MGACHSANAQVVNSLDPLCSGLRSVEDASTVEDSFYHASRTLLRAIPCDATVAFLRDSNDGWVALSCDGPQSAFFKRLRVPPNVGLSSSRHLAEPCTIRAGGEAVIIDDARTLTANEAGASRALTSPTFTVVSIFMCHIRVDGRIVGLLCAYNRSEAPTSGNALLRSRLKRSVGARNVWRFAEVDILVGCALAAAMGSSLARGVASKRHELQSILAREIILAHTLVNAASSGSAVAALDHARTLVNKTSESARAIVECDLVAFYFIDARPVLNRRYRWFVKPNGTLSRVKLGNGLLEAATHSREALSVANPSADPRFDAISDDFASTHLTSILVVPLWGPSQTAPLAILVLGNKCEGCRSLATYADDVYGEVKKWGCENPLTEVLNALKPHASDVATNFDAKDIKMMSKIAADILDAFLPLIPMLDAAIGVLASTERGNVRYDKDDDSSWGADKEQSFLGSMSIQAHVARQQVGTQLDLSRASSIRTAIRGSLSAEETYDTHLWSWMWSVLAFKDNERAVNAAAFDLLDGRNSLLERAGVDSGKAQDLISAINHRYLPNNAFHNFLHGLNTMQATAMILMAPELDTISATNEITLLLSSLVHDIGHPGTHSAFETLTESRLAMLHGFDAPLERHHVAIINELLCDAANNTDIFSHLCPIERADLRRRIANIIIATDMSRHMETVRTLVVRAELLSRGDSVYSTKDSCDNISDIAGAIVHAADFAGNIRSASDATDWNLRINTEFTSIARAEKVRGMPVTPWMTGLENERHSASLQVAFLDGIVLPLWLALSAVLSDFDIPIANAIAHREKFVDLATQVSVVPDPSPLAVVEGTGGAVSVIAHTERVLEKLSMARMPPPSAVIPGGQAKRRASSYNGMGAVGAGRRSSVMMNPALLVGLSPTSAGGHNPSVPSPLTILRNDMQPPFLSP